MAYNTMKIPGRHFLKIGSLAIASIALTAGNGKSLRAATPYIDEQDTTAKNLGYKHEATEAWR